MNRKGFTLIELLVVVAVLALLASIVFSNLGGAREGARISNALSFQSQTHSLLGSDLVGWWNFNEGSGTTARDISGYDNHGTIVGATYVDGVPGTGGSALEFDGDEDEAVIIGNPDVLYPEREITMSIWFMPRKDLDLRYMISTRSGSTGYWIRERSNRIETRIYTTQGTLSRSVTYSNAGVEIDKWHHLVSTLGIENEQHILRFYVNSNLIGQSTVAEGTILHGAGLAIGAHSSSSLGSTPDGLIDDARIYSRALTASEIQTLYTQTKDNYLANE